MQQSSSFDGMYLVRFLRCLDIKLLYCKTHLLPPICFRNIEKVVLYRKKLSKTHARYKFFLLDLTTCLKSKEIDPRLKKLNNQSGY